MAAKRGRPRGLGVNPEAVEFQAEQVGISKVELAQAAGISSGHLSDILHRSTGVSLPTAHKLAAALRCPAGMICPELTTRFVAVKPGDEAAA